MRGLRVNINIPAAAQVVVYSTYRCVLSGWYEVCMYVCMVQSEALKSYYPELFPVSDIRF